MTQPSQQYPNLSSRLTGKHPQDLVETIRILFDNLNTVQNQIAGLQQQQTQSTQASTAAGLPGTFGDAQDVAQITVGKDGRITKAMNVPIVNPQLDSYTGQNLSFGLSLNSSYQDLPGVSVTLKNPGTYLVYLDCFFSLPSGSGQILMTINDGSDSAEEWGLQLTATGIFITGSKAWLINETAGNITVKGRAKLDTGSATASAATIRAVRIGP